MIRRLLAANYLDNDALNEHIRGLSADDFDAKGLGRKKLTAKQILEYSSLVWLSCWVSKLSVLDSLIQRW